MDVAMPSLDKILSSNRERHKLEAFASLTYQQGPILFLAVVHDFESLQAPTLAQARLIYEGTPKSACA